VNWSRIVRNVLSNWTSYVVTAIVGFMLTPVVVHSLGDAGYGLWTLVLSMTGYFGVLDLGIRSSVGRFVTRYMALGDHHSVNRTASTAAVILGCGGVIGLLTTVGIAAFFFDSFRLEPQHVFAGRTALLLTGLNMSLLLPLGVFSAVLIALERFDVLSGVTIVGELARAALVVWCLHIGYGLVALALISLAITLTQYSAMAYYARSLYPRLQISWRHVDRGACAALFGFTIYRFIWIVANQLIFYSDSLVIGVFLGAAAITPYAIASSLINYGRNVVLLLTDTMAPSAARLDPKSDLAGLRSLLIDGTRLALVVALPLCLGFIFLGRQFVTLWMGEAYAGSAALLTVLTVAQLGSMSQFASAFVLTGIARHRALAYFVLAEGVVNLALSIFLVKRMGLIGVAWGTVIPHLLCTSLLVPLYTLHVLRLSVREYLVKACLGPVLCAIPVAALGYVFSMVAAPSWLTFAGEAIAMSGVFGVISYFVCLSPAQRGAIAARLVAAMRPAPTPHEV
jgi:O-antigen/teichoic acid export membrane protein